MLPILDFINVVYRNTKLKDFPKQLEDMVTDGSWAIRRSALQGRLIKQKFILEALNAPIRDGVSNKFEDIIPQNFDKEAVCIEMAPLMAAMASKDGKVLPVIRFDEVDGSKVAYANAHIIKLLWGIFPDANWKMVAHNKPLCLVQTSSYHTADHKRHVSDEIVAIVMPFVDVKEVPGFTKPAPESELQAIR